MSTVLVSTSLARIVTFWRPGSADWTWADEYHNLIRDEVTQRIRERVDSEGIDFADSFAPILLGSDGRVWDGHHRIVLALERGVTHLMCEYAAKVEPRASNAAFAQVSGTIDATPTSQVVEHLSRGLTPGKEGL